MTLARINLNKTRQTEGREIIRQLREAESHTNVTSVHEGEHPDLGHTIAIVREDGSILILSDEVYFRGD